MGRSSGDSVLIQMSGAPGSGKSTLAAELCRRRSMVALNHDVTKSALMAAGGVENPGRASYRTVLALAEDLLRQGHGVVIDSPCFYDELLIAGQQIAGRAGAPYVYVECRVDDLVLLDQRLRNRPSLPSQCTSVDPDLFRTWINGMARPETDALLVDTSRDLDDCVQYVEEHLRARGVLS